MIGRRKGRSGRYSFSTALPTEAEPIGTVANRIPRRAKGASDARNIHEAGSQGGQCHRMVNMNNEKSAKN